KSGKTGTLKLPVEIWNNNIQWDVKLPVTKDELKTVIIDPDKVFPDMDFDNNTWKAN
ncbi:MAG: peptidase, partial [Sphingobacteriales bacterium]|nr:peptidase [Sphingobacteriales bacterium]